MIYSLMKKRVPSFQNTSSLTPTRFVNQCYHHITKKIKENPKRQKAPKDKQTRITHVAMLNRHK